MHISILPLETHVIDLNCHIKYQANYLIQINYNKMLQLFQHKNHYNFPFIKGFSPVKVNATPKFSSNKS